MGRGSIQVNARSRWMFADPDGEVARLIEALDRVRTPTGILPRWRLLDWHPISRDRRPCAAIWSNSCMAEPKTSTPKGFRRSHTGSRTEHGEPCSTRPGFRLIGRGTVASANGNSSTSMAKFFFKNTSFDCIVA